MDGSFKQSIPRRMAALAVTMTIVLYWGGRIGCDGFVEEPRLVISGHRAPWRKSKGKHPLVSVGTDRRLNDIVLHDRRAAPVHFTLSRRGTKGQRTVRIFNRSRIRLLGLRRSKTPGTFKEINRRCFKDGDVFRIPAGAYRTLPGEKKPSASALDAFKTPDWCSPRQLMHFLRHTGPGKQDLGGMNIGFSVAVDRAPLRSSTQQLFLEQIGADGETEKKARLSKAARYKLYLNKKQASIEFRHGRWQLLRDGGWSPLPEQMSLPRDSASKHKLRLRLKTGWIFSWRPRYRLRQERSPCYLEIRPEMLGGGVDLAGTARLSFEKGRLCLRHTGGSAGQILYLPRGKQEKRTVLGTAVLRSGDHIVAGRTTYRLLIGERFVSLMVSSGVGTRYLLLPFFRDHPSEAFPFSSPLLNKRRLTITGGDPGDFDDDVLTVSTSLLTSSQKGGSSRPRAVIARLKRDGGKYSLQPLGKTLLYRTNQAGEFVSRDPVSTPENIVAGDTFFAGRFYFRIQHADHSALGRFVAFTYVAAFSLAALLFHLFAGPGPIPAEDELRAFPEGDPRRALSEGGGARRRFLTIPLRFLAFLAFMPFSVATYLNGMGLYVLLRLSMSAGGLNSSSYLYRQLLWSVIGVLLFSGLTILFTNARWAAWAARLRSIAAAAGEALLLPLSGMRRWKVLATILVVAGIAGVWLSGSWLSIPAGIAAALMVWLAGRELSRPESGQHLRHAWALFLLTLFLLALVPLAVALIAPGMVSNRFFLKVPGAGTIKVSELAILTAIPFFASYLGGELHELRMAMARKGDGSSISEVGIWRKLWERLAGSLVVSAQYLLLLALIAGLYTAQGDLGPGLILTACFSTYLGFVFVGRGADRLTTVGNLLRISLLLGSIGVAYLLIELLSTRLPEMSTGFSQLSKVTERLAIWHEPWRLAVGEQILQNRWALAGFRGTFQWFSNLHSDFMLTAVSRILSPAQAAAVIGATLYFPLAGLVLAAVRWVPVSASDPPREAERKRRILIRNLTLIFCGIFLFMQNAVHMGSVLSVVPMTGVTLSWISSGGTSTVVCYLVLAMFYVSLKGVGAEE